MHAVFAGKADGELSARGFTVERAGLQRACGVDAAVPAEFLDRRSAGVLDGDD
jgi:hypothetical protein